LIARRPLQIFLAVQKALFLRELGMRFSVSKSGLFWTFFEPFIQIVIFVFIKLVLFGRSSDIFDFAVFLALNFIGFNLFKNIVIKSMGSFNANKGLFIYKQVKPVDTIIARIMVEVFITGIIIIIFVFVGFYFNYDMHIKNLPMVTLGFLWLIIFSFSLGLFIAVANTFYISISKIINIAMTFLMFGSGIFYTIAMLPSKVQTLLLYNPLTHFMELLHGSYFKQLSTEYVNYNYMMLWTIILLYTGLWFYRRLEERIISL